MAHKSNTHPTLTGAEIIWATLVGEGVTTVFGYPGGAILPTYDALRKFPIHHVLVRHEQGASHMADGYARASGRVGVCIATSGPGATNLVTGIATAMMDSMPIVCITGQVSSKVLGTDAFQEIDITGITLPITKHNFLVTRAEDIAPTIREAFQIATHRPPRPGAGRHHQGRAAGHRALRLRRRRARAAPPAPHAARRVRHPSSRPSPSSPPPRSPSSSPATASSCPARAIKSSPSPSAATSPSPAPCSASAPSPPITRSPSA